MFTQARIKLTFWYLLIIMVISAFFSAAVYRGLVFELGRSLRIQTFRILPPSISDPSLHFNFENEVFDEMKRRIILQLLFVNAGILVVSGFAAYFMAGKTLKPIEEAVEGQKRFVADASHELRTPLTVMKTETEVALRDKKLDLKQAKQLLSSNLEEVDKIQSLADNLLTLSRYENPQLKLTFERIKIADIVEKAVQKVKSLADKKGIKIEWESGDFEIDANSTGLSELLIILLDNAIKYSNDKGLVIIRAEKEQKQATISVQDFGVGIKKSELPFIFDRFYRADSSRSKTEVDGYGLGLSIAKSIVDLHKGKIFVKSTVGKGSTFFVKLPLS